MNYDFVTIIKLAVATLLPVVLSVVLYFAERKTKFGKANYWVRQAVIGVLFGALTGARLLKKLDVRLLRQIFCVAILLVAINMIYQVVTGKF